MWHTLCGGQRSIKEKKGKQQILTLHFSSGPSPMSYQMVQQLRLTGMYTKIESHLGKGMQEFWRIATFIIGFIDINGEILNMREFQGMHVQLVCISFGTNSGRVMVNLQKYLLKLYRLQKLFVLSGVCHTGFWTLPISCMWKPKT